MITLNVKELQPEFPSLPTNSSLPYYNVINTNNSSPGGENLKFTSPMLTTPMIETQNEKNRNINNFVPMQYRYMIRRMQRERPIQLEGKFKSKTTT